MPVAVRRAPCAPLLAAALLAAAVAGCDAEPGFPTQTVRPTLSGVEITPTRDSLATDAPTATIPLTVRADVGGEGTVTVRVLVRYQETDSLAASATVEAAPGPLQIDVPLVVPRGATGDYAVQVATEGGDGREGDEAAAVVHFEAASLGPPIVTDVSVESPVTRVPGRVVSSTIVVTVSDPDGIANVAAVALVDPETGGVIGRIFDAGRANGATDETAGDGRYTGRLQFPSDFEPGTYTLAAIAVDRAETVSDPVAFTITVR